MLITRQNVRHVADWSERFGPSCCNALGVPAPNIRCGIGVAGVSGPLLGRLNKTRGIRMNHRITALLASAAMTFVAGSAFAQTAAPAPAAAPPAPPTLATAMSASLAANGSPMSYDMGILGSKVYVTGA